MPNFNEILAEIRKESERSVAPFDIVRRKHLKNLHDATGRNVIAYYSGWLTKPEFGDACSISDEDKNGFMIAIHQLQKNKGLDLILHTPGGGIAPTESIVSYLRKIFGNNIRAIVPQIAMSAGTMIACSCKEILMGKHSNLGPIDPQMGGLPAHGIVEEFKTAYSEIKQDPVKAAIWQPIINKYPPTLLSQSENAIKWSEEFVTKELTECMFEKDPDKHNKAKSIVASLTDYKGNKAHNRHISMEECQKMGLNVTAIESDHNLQELILTVHHCFMNSLMNTTCFKLIENHLGAAFARSTPIVTKN
jgi:ATP-dependent protease ClpP protease subunit